MKKISIVFHSVCGNNYLIAKEQAFKKLVPRIHPGAIVLLHSTSKTNADIMDELISKWKELGYSFKNLDAIK